MPLPSRRIRRILNDWTFLGAVTVTIALVISRVWPHHFYGINHLGTYCFLGDCFGAAIRASS